MKDQNRYLNTSDALPAYAGANSGGYGATVSDLNKGYTRGDHSHEPYEDDESSWEDRWAYRSKGGFLTRPMGDER